MKCSFFPKHGVELSNRERGDKSTLGANMGSPVSDGIFMEGQFTNRAIWHRLVISSTLDFSKFDTSVFYKFPGGNMSYHLSPFAKTIHQSIHD